MKKMSRPATMIVMGILLLLFVSSVLLLARNQNIFSTLASVFHKRPAAPKDSTPVWLATGSPDGTYYRLGKQIAAVGQTQGLNIQVCATRGSYDNIRLLQEGRVSLALAQIDALDAVVVHHQSAEISSGFKDDAEACNPHPEPERSAEKPVLVTYLYNEMVHVILRPHFYVNSLADLKRDAEHVWLGPCRSGSRETARRLLQASGLVESDIDQRFSDCNGPNGQNSMNQTNPWTVASDRLLAPIKGNRPYLNAFFWTRAVQTIDQPPQGSLKPDKDAKSNPPGIADKDRDPIYCLLDGEAHIAALPPEVIDRLAMDNLYVETAIPLDAYGGKRLKQGLPTVGVPTVLTAAESLKAEEIRYLINMIKNNKSIIEQGTGVELDLLERKVAEHEHLAGFVHAGAQSHLKGPDLRFVWLTAIGSLAFFLLFLLIYRPPRWLTANPSAVSYTILLFVILLLLWCGFAFKLTQAEGRFNPNFETTATSMRTMLFYVVGSFRDRKPMTRQGENLIAWALFVIPLVFGWLTSDIIKEGVRKLSRWLAGAINRAGAQSAAGWLFSIARALKRPGRKHASVPDP
ncbi:MAG: hypothetical protein DMG22_06700 [Acidobacteria bacterium]|nr:MAG: hypothetical protein DMG22_06700 [Acidobacteriota bacterium]